LTKKQKDQVSYFRTAVNCDENKALDYLRRANWDVDRACDMYFADPVNQSASQVKPKPTKKQEELFAKYKGKYSDRPN